MKKVLETVVENQGKHLLSSIYEGNWKFCDSFSFPDRWQNFEIQILLAIQIVKSKKFLIYEALLAI